MGSQTKLAMALHDQINVDLAGLKSDQVKSVLDFQMASSLAYALPLPSAGSLSDVDLGKQWEVKHARPVAKFLDDINREFVIDYTTIIRMSQAIWTFRYRLAYDPCYLHASLTRALCAANIIPGDVVETLQDIGSLDSTGISALHATENGMSVIESKRRMIERSFKDQYGMSNSFAGVEDVSDSLPGILRRSKMSSLAAALESLDRDNLSDGEYDVMMGRLNGELDRQISKEARIDGIRSQIAKHGKMSRNVVAALESLEPGIITKHPKASRIRYTNGDSDVGVVAALEAINWAKMGKWGLIGALIGFVSYIAGKIIAMTFMIVKLSKEVNSVPPEKQLMFIEEFDKAFKQGAGKSFKESVELAHKGVKDISENAAIHADLLRRDSAPARNEMKDVVATQTGNSKAADDAGKKAVSEQMAGLPKEVATLIHVSPVAPKVTPEKAAAVQEDLKKSVDMSLASKMAFFKEDTKAKLKQVVGMVYSSKDAATYESFSKIMETPFGAGRTPEEWELLKILLENGKIGASLKQHPFVYGNDATTRLTLALSGIEFSNALNALVAKTVEELASNPNAFDDRSFTKELRAIESSVKFTGKLEGVRTKFKGKSDGGVAGYMDPKQLDSTAKYFAAYKDDAIGGGYAREENQWMNPNAVRQKNEDGKSTLIVKDSVPYSWGSQRVCDELVKILDENKDGMKVGKIDVTAPISKLNSIEQTFTKEKNTEALAKLAEARTYISGMMAGVKSIELSSLAMVQAAGSGIKAYKADLDYMFKTQVLIKEFLIMVERDTATLEI